MTYQVPTDPKRKQKSAGLSESSLRITSEIELARMRFPSSDGGQFPTLTSARILSRFFESKNFISDTYISSWSRLVAPPKKLSPLCKFLSSAFFLGISRNS